MTVGPYRAAVLFFALVFLVVSATAQLPTGGIAGVVTDASGAVLPRCDISIRSLSTGLVRYQQTTASGSYYVPGLPPGIYAVRASAQGFRTKLVEARVEVGRETHSDVRLEIGAAVDTVTVTATDAQVNTLGATLEGIVSGPTIREQPLNGRQFLELAQLEPGVQVSDGGSVIGLKDYYAGVSANGHSGLTTRVTVDGLDISDELMGSIVQNISLEAVDEFQITRSGADTVTGLNGAGAVNIGTKSGTNELHGTGLLFWRDDTLGARIAQQQFPFDREQGGFTLGGPLRHDHLFAFAGYERTNQDSAVATDVPGFASFTRTWPLPFDEHTALARLDANLPRNTRAFARVTHNGNAGVANGLGGRSLSPQLMRNNANQTAAGIDAALGRFLHSFRFGYLNYDFFNDDGIKAIPGLPATGDPGGRALTVTMPALGLTIGTNSNAFARRMQDSHEFRYDGAMHQGKHSWRWGGVFDRIRVLWFSPVFSTPSINLKYTPAMAATCGSDLLCYPVAGASVGNGLGYLSEKSGFGEPFGAFSNNRVAAYMGDSWRVTPRLNVNFGARWSYEPGQDNSDLNKPAVLELFQTGLSHRNRAPNTNFAPQLGFAWAPVGGGRWVIRGAAGLHYDTKLMRDRRWERVNLLPLGVGNLSVNLPSNRLTDPLSNTTIFDLNDWFKMCPNRQCTLAMPGFLDAFLAGAEAYRAAYHRAMEQYPAGPSKCEADRVCTTFTSDYQPPYNLQINVGIQRELRPGLVLSADYVHHRGYHYQIRPDANRVGAADSLRPDSALAAMNALQTRVGCPQGPVGVQCIVDLNVVLPATQRYTIASYALYGLGRGNSASSTTPSRMAFPGNNPAFNSINVFRMEGWSRYNALQVNLRGRLPDMRTGVRNWTITASYALSRYEGTAGDQDLYFSEDYYPNDDATGFYGPTTLDRTHNLALSTSLGLPGRFRLSVISRAASPLPQSIYLPNQSAGNAEIFMTDLNGDGVTGDPLPGTSRGAYGRQAGCGATALNRLIDAYNTSTAGKPTPAGQSLVAAGLFTTEQLVSLGAVAPTIPDAPAGQVCLDWFSTTDVRISRPIRIRGERVTIEPAWEWFNLFNVANYDLPSARLDGRLTGIAGSINGTTVLNRSNRASLSGGTFSAGSPRAWQFGLRVNF